MAPIQAFTPHFILERLAEKSFSGSFQAVSMFVDISGFTRLSEVLMELGPDGAEILANVMSDVFEPLVESVYHHHGFITRFAGDAFTALFIAHPPATHLRALSAAFEMQSFIKEYVQYIEGTGAFSFNLKIGIGFGDVEWGIFQPPRGMTNYQYYFRGPAIDQSIRAERHAAGGQIILASQFQTQFHPTKNHPKVNHDAEFISWTLNQEALPPPAATTIPELNPAWSIAFMPEEIDFLAIRGEFRNVVSVFVGLQGDPGYPEMNEVIQHCYQLIRDYGGLINTIDFGDKGCTLLFFWGTPRSYENDMERAIEFVWELKMRSAIPIRVGITYRIMYCGLIGSSLRRDYGCYGRGVNLAVRQMIQADWGDIWIDQPTARKISPDYDVGFVGRFDFKGFKEKLPVFCLQGISEHAESTAFKGQMIGRDNELEELQRFIQPIFRRELAGLSVLYGESGIGKSRLLAELKLRVRQTQPDLIWFHCPADEILKKPLGPFRYALRQYFRQSAFHTEQENKALFFEIMHPLMFATPSEDLQKEMYRANSIVGAMVDLYWPGSLYSRLKPMLRFENILDALASFFKAVSLHGPVVLELEDGHWFDTDSIQFLLKFVKRIDGYPIAILASCRYESENEFFKYPPGFIETLPITCQILELDLLLEEHLAAFAKAMLHGDSSPELIELLKQKTGGNPFFIEQTLLFLQQQELLIRKNNEIVPLKADIEMPAEIRSVLISRLDQLPSDVKQMVQTASVLGREFDVTVLAHMLGNDKKMEPMLRHAVDDAIWTAQSEIHYVFRHVLMRDAAYEMQLVSRRRHFHQLAAETLEKIHRDDLFTHLGDIVYHFEQSGNVERTIYYLQKAARWASENFQNNMALEYYQKLVDLLLPSASKVDVLLDYAALLKLVGRWNQVKIEISSALALAHELNDDALIARCYNQMGNYHFSKGHHKKARKHYRQAKQIAEKCTLDSEMAQALKNIGNIHLVWGDYARAMQFYKSSRQLYEKLDDREGLSAIYNNMGLIHFRTNNYDLAMEFYQKDLKNCEDRRDYQGLSVVIGNIGALYEKMGEMEKGLDCYQKQLSLKKQLGDKRGMALAIGNMGGYYTHHGQFDRAIECYRQRINTAEELGDLVSLATAYNHLGNISYARDDYGKVLNYYRQALYFSEKLGDKVTQSVVIGNLGTVHQELGEYEQAMKLFERQLALKRELHDNSGVARAYNNMGIVFASRNEISLALDFYDRAIDSAQSAGAPTQLSDFWCNKAAAYYALEEYDKALEAIELSQNLANAHNRLGCLLKCQVLLAQIEVITNQKEDAVARLENYLARVDDSESRAELHYHLWIINRADKHRQAALALYQELFQRIPKIEYKQRLGELK